MGCKDSWVSPFTSNRMSMRSAMRMFSTSDPVASRPDQAGSISLAASRPDTGALFPRPWPQSRRGDPDTRHVAGNPACRAGGPGYPDARRAPRLPVGWRRIPAIGRCRPRACIRPFFVSPAAGGRPSIAAHPPGGVTPPPPPSPARRRCGRPPRPRG